jgi:hypothetical protein
LNAARLIPVSGIGSEKEAEQRATSAVLAVLTVVRDLSIEVFSPLGASKAQRATVEAFTEVAYKLDKRAIRPDGLVRITYGSSTWSCFVEVKTGEAQHTAEQINDYWDLARQEGVDHILTISNQIAPSAGVHPTAGLRVRSNSKVQVSHLSWTGLLTTAVRLKQHRGVSDPEQAWILAELIRYLEHSASGALAFADMGPDWVAVRDGARSGTLDKRADGLVDVVSRWDQLLRYAALLLGSEIGEDVTHQLPRAQRDPKARSQQLLDRLLTAGELDGVLRIPNTVSDVDVVADLRGQQLVFSVDVAAPDDRGAVARVTWLVKQLRESPDRLVVECYRRNARQCTSAHLGEIREDRQLALGEDGREPSRFRLVLRLPMGAGRRTGKRNPGFIDGVLDGIDVFYGEVVQHLTEWRPPAPRLKRPAPLSDERQADGTQRAAGSGNGLLAVPEPPQSFRPTPVSEGTLES